MYKVYKAKASGRVFPDEERDLEALMIGDGDFYVLSELIARMAGKGNGKINLGDSEISIIVEPLDSRNHLGWDKFMDGLAYYIRMAVPTMSIKYKAFYVPFLKDYEARQQVYYSVHDLKRAE